MKTVTDTAARELFLFADNDRRTYEASYTPVAATLDKRRARGTFDALKAVKAFEYVAEYAARRYAEEFGGIWCRIFNASTRRAAAEQLTALYIANAEE